MTLGQSKQACAASLYRDATCMYITSTPRPEFALDVMLYMLSQHCAIGLQTDCMVVVPAPMVKLPKSHVYALCP